MPVVLAFPKDENSSDHNPMKGNSRMVSGLHPAPRVRVSTALRSDSCTTLRYLASSAPHFGQLAVMPPLPWATAGAREPMVCWSRS